MLVSGPVLETYVITPGRGSIFRSRHCEIFGEYQLENLRCFAWSVDHAKHLERCGGHEIKPCKACMP
jgi:hypothetical protein